MLGILYLILCILLGKEVAEYFLLRRVRETSGNQLWIMLPMAFGSGTLLMTWALYVVAYLNTCIGGARHPLFAANFLVMGGTALGLLLLYVNRYRRTQKLIRKQWVTNHILFRKECIFFAILLVVLTAIFFYVFQIRDGVLYSGFTVFSDYAPHTSMIRSFSIGNNFPTQYPHYGGADVKYHFMFQFLTGNLEYLGLRLDFAYNIASVLSLLGFLMMLYMLTGRIMGRPQTGMLTVVLFFFRSGFTFFRFAWEHLQAGDLLTTLADNTAFIGYTTNESWGLWCFNVYLNQRHLAFGLLIVCVALWVFLDWLEDGDNHPQKGLTWFEDRLFSIPAWKSRDTRTAILVGILLGLTAFWNGAAVIGGLLILAGFALFSDGKLDYAVMALVTILLSEVQSKLFMTTSAISPSWYFGLLAEDTSLLGVLYFLLWISGIYFIGMAVVCLFLKRIQRSAMAAFFLPFVFAFCISLTPDISVNHKYIMISYAFLAMFWAWILGELFRKRHGMQLAAALLAVVLTATGVYDLVIILKDNDRSHRVGVDLTSDVTAYLEDNLTSQDLILTPEYSINEVTISGVMLYCGWPYYAWSAGYDTDRRAQIAEEIYTCEDPQRVQELVEEEGINYILFEEGMTYEEDVCREDTIAELYSLVYTSEDGRIRIYEI
jgi:hypothetical protein